MHRRGLFLVVSIVFLVSSLPAIGAEKVYEPNVWNGNLDQTCNVRGAPTLCIPLDEVSWTVVTMANDNTCASPADPNDPCQRNDDDHTNAIPLGFSFDLYGSPQTEVYINNNGNLSFGSGFCTFTPSGFPVAGFPMVAPFWGDADTRSDTNGSGVVWMQQGPNYLAVTWDHVGYYSSHTDLQNTFQVIISDGTYAPIGLGNNVCFCYGDMSWTTGDASGGMGGFGGSPATVGANKGDGVDFFQIGVFDHPGNDFNGPNVVSGVDWLDGQNFCFFAGEETNQPPIPINFPIGCVDAVCNRETCITVGFIGPEANQIVTVTVDTGGLQNLVVNNTPGNPAQVELCFTPSEAQVGTHTINFTAVDDGTPPATTHASLDFCVECPVPVDETTWGSLKGSFRDSR